MEPLGLIFFQLFAYVVPIHFIVKRAREGRDNDRVFIFGRTGPLRIGPFFAVAETQTHVSVITGWLVRLKDSTQTHNTFSFVSFFLSTPWYLYNIKKKKRKKVTVTQTFNPTGSISVCLVNKSVYLQL